MEELEHISPYFWLERMVFLVVSFGKSLKLWLKIKKKLKGFGFNDQGMVDVMKQIYAESIKPFNRQLPSAACRESIIGLAQMAVSGIFSLLMSFN